MKTLTITLHDTDNCGSSLQSYALQHFLLSNGIENEIINYVPEYVNNNGNKLKWLIKSIIYRKEVKNRKKKFDDFKSNFLKITNIKFTSYAKLKNNPPEADCYITGSDQLWNSMYKCGNDPAYYLDFVKDNSSKIAYAVSLGREKITQDNLDIVKKYVRNFSWISVREKIYIDQLKEMLNMDDIMHVCDPVLLNEIEEYAEIKEKRLFKDPYILIYMAQIPDTEFMNKMIRKAKEKFSGKVILIGSYRNRCNCDVQIRDVAPGEFLSLIENAEYIISNSFHATMFSLMYQKQFLSVLPEKNGARINEVLKIAGLLNHAISIGENINEIPTIEDYSKINEKLMIFREKSRINLIKNIKG